MVFSTLLLYILFCFDTFLSPCNPSSPTAGNLFTLTGASLLYVFEIQNGCFKGKDY